ncbi:hypothetical protein [Paenibacillus sp. NPDC057967]|uniref:hypothetical protein n=1 Tax=Paenibacillus sp. NPDC057967 TaxID=3346293 RepID=UPI0036DC492B
MRKLLLYISGGILLLFIVFIVYYFFLPSDIRLIKENTVNDEELHLSNRHMEELDHSMRVYYVKNTLGDINYFILKGRKLVTSGVISSINEVIVGNEGSDILWSQYYKPDEFSFMTGIILNDQIESLAINNISGQSIKIFNYDNYRLFYTLERIDTPIEIQGYSDSGELIYKNNN